MLIHKTKPSQADLLLEDTHDKHLVKQLYQPGDAILVTDYTTPALVSIPLCTRKDMQTVATMLKTTEEKVTTTSQPGITFNKQNERLPAFAGVVPERLKILSNA